MTHGIAILIFNNVEVLDFAGPYEVFTTASRVHGRANPGTAPLFQVQCVAKSAEPIQARAGLRVLPDASFKDANPASVLLVPGGVVDAVMACDTTLNWIAITAKAAQLVTSVCTGAFLLAQSGVIQSGPVTTHWEDVADLRRQFPGLDVQENQRWIAQGRITTSAGISAGIDMSLHLVAQLAGHDLALQTARQMDYLWQQTALIPSTTSSSSTLGYPPT